MVSAAINAIVLKAKRIVVDENLDQRKLHHS